MSANRGRVALLAALGVDMAGTGLFAPISLLYFLAFTDLPLSTIGLLVSAGTVATLPIPVLIGPLVDRWGPRPILVVGQLLQGAGFLAYLKVGGSLSVLLVVLAVAVGQRMFWCSIFTLVAEVAGAGRDAEDRAFAQFSRIQAAGLGFGTLIAGFALAGNAGTYRIVVVANAVSYLVSALLLLTVPRAARPPRPEAGGGYRDLVRDRPYLTFVGINTIFNLCAVMLGTALPVFVADGLPGVPRWWVAPLLAFNTALLTFGQTLVIRRIRPLARTRALLVAAGFFVLWLLGLALAVQVPRPILIPYLFLTMILFAIAELITAPTANALAAASAPPHLRGRYLAVMQYGFVAAQIIAPAFFGLLYPRGRAWPFVILAVVVAAAGLLVDRSRLGAKAGEDASSSVTADREVGGSGDPRTGEPPCSTTTTVD